MVRQHCNAPIYIIMAVAAEFFYRQNPGLSLKICI